MLPPDAIARPPRWLVRAGEILGHLAGTRQVAEEDAAWMLWLLNALEMESVPGPAIGVHPGDRSIVAGWKSGDREVEIQVSRGWINVRRLDSGMIQVRPSKSPAHPAARLRDDLGWCYPALAGGCDEDQMIDLIYVAGR